MNEQVPFRGFGKIARLSRDIVITEKIDGTNAQVHIAEDGTILAGSRKRWITPEDDNFGFAAWVRDNEEDLRILGPGHHFGEWWGSGVQRNYGLKERRFSLFNVHRWADPLARPTCCHVVPTLYMGPNSDSAILSSLINLEKYGSLAAPGFKDPEGIIIFHTAAGVYFKKTLEDDELPKTLA